MPLLRGANLWHQLDTRPFEATDTCIYVHIFAFLFCSNRIRRLWYLSVPVLPVTSSLYMSSSSAKWSCRSSNKAVQSPYLWDLVPKQKREQLQCHPPEQRCRYYETLHGIAARHRSDRRYWSHTRDCSSLSTPWRVHKCIALLNRMHCNQTTIGQGLWNLHLVLFFRFQSVLKKTVMDTRNLKSKNTHRGFYLARLWY